MFYLPQNGVIGISIVIPTFNRSDELRKTLKTLTIINKPATIEYEILVIDNNGPDNTQNVIKDFDIYFGNTMRYIKETQQGLSYARNRAIAEARYEIIAFLDDDVDLDVNWLSFLLITYLNDRYVAAVGGKAFLIYPFEKPSWLGNQFEGLLSKVDHGNQSRQAQPDELFGVNLSFGKKMAY